jgi:uncharacterized OB-fold protein
MTDNESIGAHPLARRPPPRTSETAFFWEGVDAGELRIQRCSSCAAHQHPPRAACLSCGSLELSYDVVDGRGTVYSYTTHHHPPVPGPQPPFDVILVSLPQGVRLLSNLIDALPGMLRVDLPVEVRFVEVQSGLTLPLFAPSDPAERPGG